MFYFLRFFCIGLFFVFGPCYLEAEESSADSEEEVVDLEDENDYDDDYEDEVDEW